MAKKQKTDREAQTEITEAGAVELEEKALDEASGGSLNFTKIQYAQPTAVKLDSTFDRSTSLDATFDADSLSSKI